MWDKWNEIDVFGLFGDNAATLQGKLCACEPPIKEKWMPTIFKKKLKAEKKKKKTLICWFLVLKCEDLLTIFVLFMMVDDKFLVLGLLAGHKKQSEDVMSERVTSIFHNFLTFIRLND